MKIKELRDLSVDELNKRLNEEQSQLAKFKLNHAVSPLENPMKIRHARRLIAKIKSILNNK